MEKYLNEQEYVVKFLTNSFKKNRLSHSYLFVGDKGNNKFNIAKELTKFILCPDGGCNECNVCLRIDHETHPNVKIIQPEDSTIKKEAIIELQSDFSKTSLEKGPKVYILNDAHLMNDSSSNSLLKFIEEPVSDIYGILLTTNEDGILPTIRSRSQIIYFKNQDKELIKQELIAQGFDITMSEVLPLITNSLDDAIHLANEDNIKSIVSALLDTFKVVGKKSIYLNYILNYSFEKDDLKMYLKLLSEFFKDILYLKLGKDTISYKYERETLQTLADRYSTQSLIKVIDILVDTLNKLTARLNEGLLVDSTLLKIEEVLNESC